MKECGERGKQGSEYVDGAWVFAHPQCTVHSSTCQLVRRRTSFARSASDGCPNMNNEGNDDLSQSTEA
jgi:hypothetical protein